MNSALPICPYCKAEVHAVARLDDEHTGTSVFFCPACRFVLGISATPTALHI